MGAKRAGPERDPRRARVLGWLVALACVAFGTTLRIQTALGNPDFDATNPRGMLRSDPGLLYYLTERIVESGGRPPTDFRADPRIEHPESTDVLGTFAVGQEFAVAWGYLLFGQGEPLHVFCVRFMAIWASLTAVCVFGLALELCGKPGWAALAAALCAVMPANYRTAGWILMNEDFSIPWFALHLWLLARAARVRTIASIGLASLPLGIAVSTWHATQFFLAVEAVCVFAWFLRTGRNPLAARGTWVLPATLLAFGAVVPVLRTTAFALSLPMQIVLAMWLSGGARRRERTLACAFLALAAGSAFAWSRLRGGGIGEYGHVFALMLEKVRHLGRLPADPTELPVEVRMMWQGPFATLDLLEGAKRLGFGALALAPAGILLLRSARTGRVAIGQERELVASALAWASILVAWLVERTILLAGLVLPAVLAAAAGRWTGARVAIARVAMPLAWVAVLAQAWFCSRRVEQTGRAWYAPPQRQAELAALLDAIPSRIPAGEAVAADFVTSTAILAHTRHPILFQPKWESERSRGRAVELFETFYHRSPEELRVLLTRKYRCRFLVVDRAFFELQRASLYVGAISDGRFRPGTCAESLLSRDPAVLSGLQGFRLLYRSPQDIRFRDGSSTDFYRLFELER